MINAIFSKREAIKFGWQKMKENFWKFLFLILIYLILVFTPIFISEFFGRLNQASGSLNQLNSSLAAALNFIGQLFSFILSISFFKVGLKIVDGQKIFLKDIFYSPLLFFKYLLATIIFIIIFYVGLILLFFPGIIFAIRFQFYGLFITEGAGPIESLKNSWRITKGSIWNLFLFYLLIMLISIAGLLALVIGTFWTAPTILIAWAYIYRKLEKSYKESYKLIGKERLTVNN